MIRYPFVERNSSGKKVRATFHDVASLCRAWNNATCPYRPMTEQEHNRAKQYARAIKKRMEKCGFTYGRFWRELSNGSMLPIAPFGYRDLSHV